MNTPISHPTRGYFESVLARYNSAKSEFLTVYEQLQSDGNCIITQRQNALAALTDTDHLVRRAASRMLIRHASALAEYVDLLIPRLRDYDCEVILNLCAVLAALGGKAIKAIDALNWHTSGRNAALRMAAIIDVFGKGLCAGIAQGSTKMVSPKSFRKNPMLETDRKMLFSNLSCRRRGA